MYYNLNTTFPGQAGDEEVILSAFNASSRNDVSLVRSGIQSQVRNVILLGLQLKFDSNYTTVYILRKMYSNLCSQIIRYSIDINLSEERI